MSLTAVKTPRKRCVNRDEAAEYLGVSTSTLDRLIGLGKLRIVRLPVTHKREGGAKAGVSRSVLIDVDDLDRLIDESKA